MPEDSEHNLINKIKEEKNSLQLFFVCCWRRKRAKGTTLRRTDKSWIYNDGSK